MLNIYVHIIMSLWPSNAGIYLCEKPHAPILDFSISGGLGGINLKILGEGFPVCTCTQPIIFGSDSNMIFFLV